MIDFVGIVFAILIAIGGVIGYARAGSVKSLWSGIGFGLGIGAGAWLNSLEEPIPYVQLAILSLLILVMFVRWYATRAFMPPGMIVLLSLAVMVWTVFVYLCHEQPPHGIPVPGNTTEVVVGNDRKLE